MEYCNKRTFADRSKEELNHDPFTGMNISSHDPLEGLCRSKCPGCQASRMYFCYKCYLFVETLDESKMPKVKLPIKVDVVKHPNEKDGKSTAVHAAMLAREDVTIYTYPSMPDYRNFKQDVVLLYPSDEAKPLEFYTKEANADDKNETGNGQRSATFTRVVVIDSTWKQVHSIKTDERLQGLRHVMLNSHVTNYWRHQFSCPDTHLATIEAIHLFCVQYQQIFHPESGPGHLDDPESGHLDDLLYFFAFFHKKVRHKQLEYEKSSQQAKKKKLK